MWRMIIAFGCLCLLTPNTRADDAIPGVGLKPAEHGQAAQAADPGTDLATGEQKQDSAELVTIVGKRVRPEGQLVGPYKQPVWTVHRRFPTTRVFLIPPGETTLEYWLITSGNLDPDSPAGFESRFEFEYGLGHRLQFDIYLNTYQATDSSALELSEQALELRYAFADWGKLWGNPTLYFEWARKNHGPQAIEGKLLLGDQLNPAWFWGVNLVCEGELGGERENEYALSMGVSHPIIDGILSVGLEGKIAFVDKKSNRFEFEKKEFLVGPSLQVKPLPGIHFDLVPLLGVEINSETEGIYQIFFIIGNELSNLF